MEVTVRPASTFPVPNSEGYQVYGALLSILENFDKETSHRVHDSPLGSIHSPGLLGAFRSSEKPHHKTVTPEEIYTLSLGLIDNNDQEIFEALVNALVLEGENLKLAQGLLVVEGLETENTTHSELLAKAARAKKPVMEFEFLTPACIEDAEGVTTMFPHRVPVFQSLLSKWNQTAPSKLELDINRETIARNIIEKPDTSCFDTHSVLVARVDDGDGTRPIFRQGFTGRVDYEFKHASDSVKNAIVALALFGEYSGLGSAVARGCGHLSVEVEGR
jgi:CRISPR-associated endoribonuclease Cas6